MSGPTRAPAGTPLYVHLPFCVVKCSYCDFYSVQAEGQDLDGFLELLIREAEARAPKEPKTVFFGGGTPSLLSSEQLRDLLDALDSITGFRSSAIEATAECNPESLDTEKARTLRAAGLNRLSIGFQSLRPETLELFGRVHSAEQSFSAYKAARNAGFENLSVDMIFAAPGESAEQWELDLRQILALEPNHFSAYNLTFEESTPLQRWLEKGQVQKASEDCELEHFWITRKVASELGYQPYEISNFSRPDRQCIHNQNYWRNGQYVGIGPSAASKVGQRRFGNARSLTAWGNQVRKDPTCPHEWEERLEPAARLGETWWLGLRTSEGVDPIRAQRTADWRGELDFCVEEAKLLQAQGLVERCGQAWILSERGIPLADMVAAKFLRPDTESDSPSLTGPEFSTTSVEPDAPGFHAKYNTMHFADRLDRALEKVSAPCVLGLDPHIDLLPEEFSVARNDAAPRAERAEALGAFCCQLLELCSDRVAVVKPQSAFFELFGADGAVAWEKVLLAAHNEGLLVIGDVKRNDIASSAAAYAEAHLYGGPSRDPSAICDAMTVNPYLGSDSVEPFLEACGKDRGIFVLVRTSNPGSAEFQLHGDPPLWQVIAKRVDQWGEASLGQCGLASVGAVVGATHREELAQIRKSMPNTVFLLPGYGAQGAAAADLAGAFREDGRGALVSASRSVAFAYRKDSGKHWKDAASKALDAMITDLQSLRPR